MSKKPVPVKDSGPSLQLGQKPTIAPDGKSVAAYNAAHGRKPKAPVVGGHRKKAYDALLGKDQKVPRAYGKRGS